VWTDNDWWGPNVNPVQRVGSQDRIVEEDVKAQFEKFGP
jgi:hypothetical protein